MSAYSLSLRYVHVKKKYISVLQRWDSSRDLRQMEDTMNRLWRGFGGVRNYREGTDSLNRRGSRMSRDPLYLVALRIITASYRSGTADPDRRRNGGMSLHRRRKRESGLPLGRNRLPVPYSHRPVPARPFRKYVQCFSSHW